jgi:hypothetical protein
MRYVLPLIAVAGALAACSNSPHQVAASPPAVSYRVNGNDMAQTNATADQYCQRYGMAAQLQSLQRDSSGNVATYVCGGSGTAYAPPSTPYDNNGAYGTSAGVVPYPGSESSGSSMPPPVRCADFLHQDRPGGTDYRGPPVPGCP